MLTEVQRTISVYPSPNVRFDMREVDLVNMSLGKKGIIFLSQPGAGKSHIIKNFSEMYSARTEGNVLVRSLKWSDTMRDVVKQKKQRPLTQRERTIVADKFLQKLENDNLRKAVRRRRGFRTHPRASFTIAEIPDGVVDMQDLQQYIDKGFLLINLVPDPKFQEIACRTRAQAWDLPTGAPAGAMWSDPPPDIEELRKSAAPAILQMAIKRSDAQHRKLLFPGEGEFLYLQRVPLPARRDSPTAFTLRERALGRLVYADTLKDPSNYHVVYNTLCVA